MTDKAIQISVRAGDKTLDAIIRLLAAQGAVLHIQKFEWSDGAADVGGFLHIEPARTQAQPQAPLTLDPEAFIAAGASMPMVAGLSATADAASAAAAVVTEAATTIAGASVTITEPETDAPFVDDGNGLDVQPADDDAQYRGPAQPQPMLTEADAQSLIVDRLAANPNLSDVCTKLLKPLAQRGYAIDGDRQAFLTRTANEFSDYRTTHYATAAALLLKGRHVFFPEQAEIYAALGKAARLDKKAA